MARLIDADALIETMESHVTTVSVCSTTIEARAKGEMKRTCISDVANAPTIDAIPVEWINTLMLDGEPYESKSAWRVLKAWKREQEAHDVRTQTAND